MTAESPTTRLDKRFSSGTATATPWREARAELELGEVYWITTVRADGRPHVTPAAAVWLDGSLYFTTGPTEQKAKNLEHNRHCVITTGCNSIQEGMDVVIEGVAVDVLDEHVLRRLAGLYDDKYRMFHFEVRDGAFEGDGGRAIVFEVAPQKAFGFVKGDPFGQTTWRFDANTPG